MFIIIGKPTAVFLSETKKGRLTSNHDIEFIIQFRLSYIIGVNHKYM